MRKSNFFKDNFKNKDNPERKFSLTLRSSLDHKLPFEVVIVHPDYNDGNETLIGQFRDMGTATHSYNYWIQMLPDLEKLIFGDGEVVLDNKPKGSEPC